MLVSATSLVLGALLGLSSCTKDDMVSDAKVQRTTEFIPTHTPTPEPTPDPIEWRWEKDSINHGGWYEFNINGAEVYSGAHQRLSGVARINLEKYEYYTEDTYRDLSVQYANSHRTFGAAQVSGRKYTRTASFAHEDGQITYVNVNINNDSIAHAEVSDVKIIDIKNLEEASTRAQYVSDTLRTEFIAEVEFEVNLDGERYSYSELLKDTCTRYLLSEDEIIDTKITSKREMIDPTAEKVTVIKTVTMQSREKHETTSTYILPIKVETITFEPRNTMSFDWAWIGSDGLHAGSEEFLKKDGYWTINVRKDTYDSMVGWNDEFITPTYYISHCSAVFNDGTDTVEFGMLEPKPEEVSTVVNLLSSDREGYEMAKVVNTIKVNYEGMAQNASEDVILYKEVEEPEPAPVPDPVIDGYWDEVTLIDVITDNFRRVSIDWIITTDGVVTDRVNYTKEFPRTLVCQSDWSVDADDFNQNTTGLKAVLSKSTPSYDGAWTWDAEAYTIAENATGTGWTKSNNWASTEANGISVTRDGKTYHFADKSVSVNSNATVDGNGNYTSKLAYTFGDNVKSSDAPGKINQKVAPEPDPFFPKNWGKILGANQTIAPTANHDGYVYTLVFRFENGTLGVIMNGGESQINWDNFSHFTTDTDQSINGMSYLKGQDSWMFVSADDYADALTYVQTNGQMVDNIAYPKAKSLGWDEGHLVNNHASVFTSRYSMSIVDNVITISDTYTGVNYGSFDSAK